MTELAPATSWPCSTRPRCCTPRSPPHCAANRSRTWATARSPPPPCASAAACRGPWSAASTPASARRRACAPTGSATSTSPRWHSGSPTVTHGAATPPRSSGRATARWPTSRPRRRCPGSRAQCCVPVARTGDPQRPDDALRFGERVAPRLLDRNPDVVLHHMHDAVQDELMVARMAYFRTKWRTLPDAYARFLDRLAPGAPVVLVEDSSTWPVVRVGERHVFQTGAQGGRRTGRVRPRPAHPAAGRRGARGGVGCRPGVRYRRRRLVRRARPPTGPAALHRPAGPGARGRRGHAGLVPGQGRAGRPAAGPVVRARRPVAHDPRGGRPILDLLRRAARAPGARRAPRRRAALPVGRRAAVPARSPLRGHRHARRVARHGEPARRHRPPARPRPPPLPARRGVPRPLRPGARHAAPRRPAVEPAGHRRRPRRTRPRGADPAQRLVEGSCGRAHDDPIGAPAVRPTGRPGRRRRSVRPAPPPGGWPPAACPSC